MAVSLSLIPVIFLVQLLSYTVKGLIGFGNPLISAPLLSMCMDNALITPGTLLTDTPINLYLSWKNRSHFRWRRILPLMLANMAGAVPGTLLLRYSMPRVIKTFLGIVVVILGVDMALQTFRPRKERRDVLWLQLVVSAFSGLCAGLFGINMFVTTYLQRTAKDYDEFKGSLCFFFLGACVFLLVFYGINGLLTVQVLLFGLVSVPAVALAMLLARFIGPKIREKQLHAAAIVLFLAGGVSIIVKSMVFHV